MTKTQDKSQHRVLAASLGSKCRERFQNRHYFYYVPPIDDTKKLHKVELKDDGRRITELKVRDDSSRPKHESTALAALFRSLTCQALSQLIGKTTPRTLPFRLTAREQILLKRSLTQEAFLDEQIDVLSRLLQLGDRRHVVLLDAIDILDADDVKALITSFRLLLARNSRQLSVLLCSYPNDLVTPYLSDKIMAVDETTEYHGKQPYL